MVNSYRRDYEMQLLTSNSAGTKEWIDSMRGYTLSAYVEDSPRLVLVGSDTPGADRQEWARASLEGLERWEAEHGLGRGDVV